jgi:hypothetical protein
MRFTLPMRLPLARTLIAVVTTLLTVRAAFVSHVVLGLVSGRTGIAFVRYRWLRLRLGHACTDRAPVGGIIAAALSDHPVEPLIDRHVDALRRVALTLARLRTETSQIPRTARLHPCAQNHIGRGRVRPPLGPALVTKRAHGTALFPRMPTFPD